MFYIFITFGLDFEILGLIGETKDYICDSPIIWIFYLVFINYS